MGPARSAVLDCKETVPPDNNFGERQIRTMLQAPALVAFSIANALKTYLITGQLPPQPEKTFADG